MTFLEYFLFFQGERSAFSDRCVKEADAFHLVFSCRLEGKYAGYLCAVFDNPLIRITYGYTLPEYRRKGVFTELVRFLMEHCNTGIRTPISVEQEYFPILKHTFEKLAFQQGESVSVFTCYRENYGGWQQFMDKKGRKMCQYLQRQGYEAVSFAEADPDLIRQIKESPRSEYQNPLSPESFFDYPEKMLSRDLSFAAVKDKRLSAYTLVTRNTETKVIFEHISESALEKGTGIILLPFSCAMEQFYESGCTHVSYAMYGSNLHANAFREKLLKPLNTHQTCLENYFYYKTAEPV